MASQILTYAANVFISEEATYFFSDMYIFPVEDIEEKITCFLMTRHSTDNIFPRINVLVEFFIAGFQFFSTYCSFCAV